MSGITPPVAGMRINWADPITQGLRFLAIPDGGPNLTELVLGRTVFSTGVNARRITNVSTLPYNPVAANVTGVAGSGWDFGDYPGTNFTNAFTVAWMGSSPNFSNQTIPIRRTDGTRSWQFAVFSSLARLSGVDTLANANVATWGYAANQLFNAVATYSGAVSKVGKTYLNSVLRETTSGGSLAAVQVGGSLSIGGSNADNMAYNLAYVGLWDRELSAVEVARWNADPYCMVRRPSPKIYWIGGTGAAAQSAAISPATITLTPAALTASPGTASVALSPATITLTPEALTASPGTASVALSPATITLEPVALGASPGTASVALSPATITLTAQALGFSAADPAPIRRRHRTDTDARDPSANRPTGPRGRETTWWD